MLASSRGLRIAGERWEVILDLLGQEWRSVLDIGCRDRALARLLPDGARYVGLDLEQPADVIASAEERLPFDSDSFDSAVLADVLEHLDDPHLALDEAMRVARSAVVVALPNLYTLILRAQLTAGRTFDKYELGPERQHDRHRWFLNFDQAANFVRGRADRAGWTVSREHGHDRPFNRRALRVAYAAARTVGSPNLWAYEYMARLEPDPSRAVR